MPREDEGLACLLELDGRRDHLRGRARSTVHCQADRHDARNAARYFVFADLPRTACRRLIGYDNAHGVPHRGGRFVRRQSAFDHWHRDETDEGQPYRFVSAEKLIADFFDEIARILKERTHD